jgi:hypothetical protein
VPTAEEETLQPDVLLTSHVFSCDQVICYDRYIQLTQFCISAPSYELCDFCFCHEI